VVDEVLALIHDLPRTGSSVLLIEQRAREALAISHRGYVMHLGEVVAEGAAETLLNDRRLGELFFGGVEGLSVSLPASVGTTNEVMR
jgi:branched-chain amino acid transport system ATP-binding protein